MITLPCPVCGKRLEIPDEVTHFACTSCASELEARRGGGIVTLVKVSANPKAELEALEKELAAVTQQEMIGVPAYVLLRHDFYRLGKLHVWNITFAGEEELERIFTNLKPAELDKIITFYQDNAESQTLQWLLKVKELRTQIAQLKQEAGKRSTGSPA